MEKICEKISCYLLKGTKATAIEIDEIRFGLELIITQIILLMIIVSCGLYLNMISETIVFLITMVTLRSYVDGYHASSFKGCMMITTMVYLVCMLSYKLLNNAIIILIILFSLHAFFIQESGLSKQSINTSKILLMISIGCIVVTIQYPVISNVIAMTLFITSLSMEVKRNGIKRKSM